MPPCYKSGACKTHVSSYNRKRKKLLDLVFGHKQNNRQNTVQAAVACMSTKEKRKKQHQGFVDEVCHAETTNLHKTVLLQHSIQEKTESTETKKQEETQQNKSCTTDDEKTKSKLEEEKQRKKKKHRKQQRKKKKKQKMKEMQSREKVIENDPKRENTELTEMSNGQAERTKKTRLSIWRRRKEKKMMKQQVDAIEHNQNKDAQEVEKREAEQRVKTCRYQSIKSVVDNGKSKSKGEKRHGAIARSRIFYGNTFTVRLGLPKNRTYLSSLLILIYLD